MSRGENRRIIVGIIATFLFHSILATIFLIQHYNINDIFLQSNSPIYLDQFIEDFQKDKGRKITDIVKEVTPEKTKTPIIQDETTDTNEKVDTATTIKDTTQRNISQWTDTSKLNNDTTSKWNQALGNGSGGAGGSGDSTNYLLISEMPTFQGKDMNAFGEWFQKHFNPRLEVDYLQNRITLSFLIDRDGSIKEVKALNCNSPAIESEINRIIKITPNFTPARRNGWPMKLKLQMTIVIN